MWALLQDNGRQRQVIVGDTITVPSTSGDLGSTITFFPVMASDGTPRGIGDILDCQVQGEIVQQIFGFTRVKITHMEFTYRVQPSTEIPAEAPAESPTEPPHTNIPVEWFDKEGHGPHQLMMLVESTPVTEFDNNPFGIFIVSDDTETQKDEKASALLESGFIFQRDAACKLHETLGTYITRGSPAVSFAPDAEKHDRLDDEAVRRYASDGSFGGHIGIQDAGDVEALAREVLYWRKKGGRDPDPMAFARRLQAMAARGAVQVKRQLARMRAAGQIDDNGNILVPWPDDMKPGSTTDL